MVDEEIASKASRLGWETVMLRRALYFGIRTGTVAIACTSLMMLSLRLSRAYQGKHPPEEITEGIIEGVSGKKKLHGRKRVFATTVAHEIYGVAAASLFACLWQRFGPKRRWPVIHGMLFSLGLWLASYRGWVPEFNLMPSPERDLPGRVIANLASHLVYGAVLGADARKLQRFDDV